MIWVIVQIVIFFGLLLPSEDADFSAPDWAEIPLILIAAAGALILGRAIYDLRSSLAVSPTPKSGGKLQMKGIYGVVRHPMYLAVLLLFGSGILMSGSFMRVRLFIILVIFFMIKVWHEENLLVKKYPKYKKYRESVGAFLPKLPIQTPRSSKKK